MNRTLVILSFVWLAPLSAMAAGSLTISILDERSRPVEGTVTVTPQGGGGARSCTTRAGQCSVANLAPGSYRVSATTVRAGSVMPVSVSVLNGRAVRARLTAQAAAASAPMLQVGGQAPTGPRVVGSTQPRGVPQTHPGGVTVVGGAGGVTPVGPPTVGRTIPGQGPVPLTQRTTAQAGTVSVSTTTTTTRNLGSGNHWSIRGACQDQRSRPVDGTVTVTQNGILLGSVTSTGGAFQVYDLAPGTYRLSFTALSGQRALQDVHVQSGAAASVRLTIQR